MTDTSAATGLTPKQWDDKFFMEYLSENRFKGEMGTSPLNIIQVKEDLSKAKGDTLHFALVNKLTGNGVTNGSTLEGNEEALDSRSFAMTITERAHAVRSDRWQAQLSSIDIRKAAKAALKDWAMENTRDQIITCLSDINGVAYGTATAAQRDAWVDDNLDRVLFGDAKGNVSTSAPAGGATYDHSASLAAITTSMTLGTAEISLMKRMAKTASPKIRPVKDSFAKDGKSYYILYVPSLMMRDLQADTALQNAQRSVSLTKENSRLFEGGDLLWDGVIIKEIEDLPSLGGVGASSAVVSACYLCGAQAIGYAIAERWKSAEEMFDYGRKKGVAIMEMGGFAKLIFGSGSSDTADTKDHGVLTGFFATAADA